MDLAEISYMLSHAKKHRERRPGALRRERGHASPLEREGAKTEKRINSTRESMRFFFAAARSCGLACRRSRLLGVF